MKDNIIEPLSKWLGKSGLDFFREIKSKYGRVDAIFMEGKFPHMVHFREGMSVRNKLRELTNNSWSTNEYDDNWANIVEKCLEFTQS